MHVGEIDFSEDQGYFCLPKSIFDTSPRPQGKAPLKKELQG